MSVVARFSRQFRPDKSFPQSQFFVRFRHVFSGWCCFAEPPNRHKYRETPNSTCNIPFFFMTRGSFLPQIYNLQKCQPQQQKIKNEKEASNKKKATFCTDSKQYNFSDFPVFTKIATILKFYITIAYLCRQLRKSLAIVQVEKTRFFTLAILRCCKNSKRKNEVYSSRQSIGNKTVLQTWPLKLTSMFLTFKKE